MQFYPRRVAFVISAKRIITSQRAGCNDSLHTTCKVYAVLAQRANSCYQSGRA